MIDLDDSERLAWASGTVLWGAGDVATTTAGLTVGAVERSPVGAATIAEFGLAGLLAHKLAALALFAALFLCWRRFGRRTALGVPIGLALLGVGLTAWNGAVIAVEVGI